MRQRMTDVTLTIESGCKEMDSARIRPVLLFLAAALLAVLAHSFAIRHYGEKNTMTSQTSFYCNIKALNPTERAAHKELTDRLIAARRKITETPDGYEFQFDASAITFPDLATWSVAEAKCCTFFNFHLDLNEGGSLLFLRLTGPDGIKPFIRLEFAVPAH